MQKTLATYILMMLISVSFFSYGTDLNASTRPTIYAESVLAYTNVQRYREGVPFLRSNKKLSEVALIKMRDMFTRQYFEHESPTGESVSDLAKDVGYEYIVVGENLALGDFSSSKDVVDAWMDSKGHRENILADKYTEIGIAAGRSTYHGSNAWIIVQSFGRPKSSCPTVDTKLGLELKTLQERLGVYARVADVRKEQAERTDGTLSQKKARVEAYNLVARLHNNLAEKYKDLIVEYNKGVGSYNECLEDIIN